MNVFPLQDADGVFNTGLTLRDYFAAKAMQTLIISKKTYYENYLDEPSVDASNIADLAYIYADEMIRASDEQ